MQNYFVNKNNSGLAKKIKKHLRNNKYDFIIFSKYINLPLSNYFKKLNWKECVKSPDIDIAPELYEIALRNFIFKKNTYSIFKAKGFINFLKKKKIKKLYFCGLDLDACILASAFEAFDLGFDFEILENLTDSRIKSNFKCAKKIIKRNFKK